MKPKDTPTRIATGALPPMVVPLRLYGDDATLREIERDADLVRCTGHAAFIQVQIDPQFGFLSAVLYREETLAELEAAIAESNRAGAEPDPDRAPIRTGRKVDETYLNVDAQPARLDGDPIHPGSFRRPMGVAATTGCSTAEGEE